MTKREGKEDPRRWPAQRVSSGIPESPGGCNNPSLAAPIAASIRRNPKGRYIHNDPKDEVRGF